MKTKDVQVLSGSSLVFLRVRLVPVSNACLSELPAVAVLSGEIAVV